MAAVETEAKVDSSTEVLYGTTDSIFVKHIRSTLEEASRAAANHAARVFRITGLELEVEGILRTLLIKAKNRYFGLLHTTPESPAIVERRGTLGRAKSTAELVARVEETAI